MYIYPIGDNNTVTICVVFVLEQSFLVLYNVPVLCVFLAAWAMSMDQGEFAYGAGHVDPIKAVNPGLVYEVDKSDHINFLCGMNYILKMLQLISGEAVTCTGKTLPKNLNYPSMTARVAAGKQFQVNFSRTLRNLGMRSTYKAEVSGSKFDVRVIPEALSLNTMHEKESFELTVCLFQGMVLKTVNWCLLI